MNKKTLRDLQPGDEVEVYIFLSHRRFAKVAKVHKRYLVLDDGSKYDFDGYKIPRTNRTWTMKIRLATPQRVQEVKDMHARERLYWRIRDWLDACHYERETPPLDWLQRMAVLVREIDPEFFVDEADEE